MLGNINFFEIHEHVPTNNAYKLQFFTFICIQSLLSSLRQFHQQMFTTNNKTTIIMTDHNNNKSNYMMHANLFLAKINWCHSQTFPKPAHRQTMQTKKNKGHMQQPVVRIHPYSMSNKGLMSPLPNSENTIYIFQTACTKFKNKIHGVKFLLMTTVNVITIYTVQSQAKNIIELWNQ